MNNTVPPSADRGPVLEGIAAFTRPFRQVARSGVHWLERALHPMRHRRASQAIKQRKPVDGVLFICLGNICRSPYAEFRLRERLGSAGTDTPLRIDSAGFILPGRPSPEVALATADSRGIDLHEHRSQKISSGMLGDFDLVIAMTSEQVNDLHRQHDCADAVHLGDLDPTPLRGRDIEDPYGGESQAFEEVYDRIDRALELLERLLAESEDEDSPTVEEG